MKDSVSLCKTEKLMVVPLVFFNFQVIILQWNSWIIYWNSWRRSILIMNLTIRRFIYHLKKYQICLFVYSNWSLFLAIFWGNGTVIIFETIYFWIWNNVFEWQILIDLPSFGLCCRHWQGGSCCIRLILEKKKREEKKNKCIQLKTWELTWKWCRFVQQQHHCHN